MSEEMKETIDGTVTADAVDETAEAAEETAVAEGTAETAEAEIGVLPSAEAVQAEDTAVVPVETEPSEPPKERIETYNENIRITVAITDADGNPLQARTEDSGEVYLVQSRGTRVVAPIVEDGESKPMSKRAKKAIGLTCFFSIMFIALAVLLKVVFAHAFPDVTQLQSVATILSGIAQVVAYLFLAIYGFNWINAPDRKLGWKIAYWIGIAFVFVALVVDTTLAFVDLGVKPEQMLTRFVA